MVRPGFRPREDFNTSPLVKNQLGEG